MRRVLALLAAAAMVVVAVVVRDRLQDDESADVESAPPTSVPTGTVICDPSLQVACAALPDRSTSEPGGTTISTLSDPDATDVPGAWVTLAPLPAIVDENRERALGDAIFPASEALATTPLVFVARKDRGDVLVAVCGGTITWSCLADQAQSSWGDLGGNASWGRVKIGHDHPERTARGALVFAWAASSIAGTTSFNVGDGSLAASLSQLERAVPTVAFTGSSALQVMVTQLGSLDVVATTLAEADPLVGPGSSRAASFTIYPDAVAGAEAVVAVTGGGDSGALAGPLREALSGAGWQPTEGDATGATSPGLPGPGVVEALRTRVWQEVR